MEECTEEMSSPLVQATEQAVETDSNYAGSLMAVGSETDEGTSSSFSRATICQEQRDDKNIDPIIGCKQSNKRPVGQQLKPFSAQSKCLLRDWEKLSLNREPLENPP